jgi:hypothetical protein
MYSEICSVYIRIYFIYTVYVYEKKSEYIENIVNEEKRRESRVIDFKSHRPQMCAFFLPVGKKIRTKKNEKFVNRVALGI